MKNIPLTILLLTICLSGFCQDKREQVLAELTALSGKYRNASVLAFDVKYRYATEDNPGVYLDSLQGHYQINGSSFFYEIDKTQTLFNGQYVLVIYKEDSLIYLSKPSENLLSANPAVLLDSVIASKEVKYAFEENKHTKKIILAFKNDPQYKRITYEINKKSGYLSRVTQVVNSAQMYDPEMAAPINKEGNFSIVEVVFDHYEKGKFDNSIFDLEHYVKKQDNAYVARSPYQSYKVFLATPNL